MVCRVKDVVGWLDETFPPSWAEGWDLVGLQLGDPEAPVEAVLVALDPTVAAVQEAVRGGASLLVTHHPLWLRPIAAIHRQDPAGRVIWAAVRGGVSIFCAHTNLDRAPGGPNDLLARRLELQRVEPLLDGMGRVGEIPGLLSLESLCHWVQSRLHCAPVRVAGPPLQEVRRVALCCGSGGALLDEAHRCGAQVLVTGDGKYHDARKAEALGMALLDVGHFASERPMIPWLTDRLDAASRLLGWGMRVMEYQGEREPFRVPRRRDRRAPPEEVRVG